MCFNYYMFKDISNMFLEKREKNSVIFNMKGDISTYDCEKLEKQIDKYLKEGYINFVFNFENITYISSRIIGILVGLHRKLPYKGNLILVSPGPYVLKMLSILKVDNIFKIIDKSNDLDSYLNYGE